MKYKVFEVNKRTYFVLEDVGDHLKIVFLQATKGSQHCSSIGDLILKSNLREDIDLLQETDNLQDAIATLSVIMLDKNQ